MLGINPCGQLRLELLSQCSRLFVLRTILGGDDDFANIAQVDFGYPGERRFGIVAPFGRS